ncbi:hypothetical protein K2Y00_02560 [Patescibacteria group bacterium]|nr:hypothetical protein [Patescibacteria group bacterium]
MSDPESFGPATPRAERELPRSTLVECIQKARKEVGLHVLDAGRIGAALAEASKPFAKDLKRSATQGREYIYPSADMQRAVLRAAVLEGPSARYLTEDEKERLLTAALRLLAHKQGA